MFYRQKSFSMLRATARMRHIVAALGFIAFAAHGAEPGLPASGHEQNSSPIMQLAAKIAAASGAAQQAPDPSLIPSYEKVYGDIEKIPGRWPALVRRALICQHEQNLSCVRTSLEAIDKLGGIGTLPLNRLFEVSRFGMSDAGIRARFQDSAQAGGSEAVAPPSSSAAATLPAEIGPTPAQPVLPPAKVAQTKTIAQKALNRLARLGRAEQSGYFLDALFIVLSACLLLAYFLFSAIRSRNAERAARLRLTQECQALENLRVEEKLHADHTLWSEQLKAEVALEAQKVHAEEILRLAQLAADEANKTERALAAQALKAEREKGEQASQAERRRAEEAIKMEHLKAAEAVKLSKLRADQAIDAYDQMAAKELVHAHKQNDALQEALNQEKEWREAQLLKTDELLQMVQTLKAAEADLQERIQAEQRTRIMEVRQLAEKLKAAQQAAAALQASLAAIRSQKADLERRVGEATRAADLRLAEVRQVRS